MRSIDLSIINVALEYASFKDYRVRDSLVALLKELDLDLDDIGFEPCEQTKKAFTALEDTITEVESAHIPKPARIEENGEGDEEGTNVKTVKEEIDEFVVAHAIIKTEPEEDDKRPSGRVVNVDAELEENA